MRDPAINAEPLTAEEVALLRAVREMVIARGLYSIAVGPYGGTLQGHGFLLDAATSRDDGEWTFEDRTEDVKDLGQIRWCATSATKTP